MNYILYKYLRSGTYWKSQNWKSLLSVTNRNGCRSDHGRSLWKNLKANSVSLRL